MGLERYLRTHRDATLAILLTIVTEIELWIVRVPDPDDLGVIVTPTAHAAAAIAAGVFTLSLAWRRPLPLLVLGLGMVAAALSLAAPFDTSIGLVAALVVTAYSVGASLVGPKALLGGAGVAAIVAVVALRHPGAVEDLADLSVITLNLGMPWVAGLAMRLRREREAVLERRTELLGREQHAQARAAVAEERARISRELHDVVAHALSIMVLQARGGRRSLARDLDQTRQALETIDRMGSEALAEMRRLLGVLRPDDAAIALDPQPGLRHLPALVDQVRDAGLPVEVTVEGSPVDLPVGVDLSAYRILQEGLTNALRHAGPTSASVTVRYGSELELEVVDSGVTSPTESPGGQGLVGMRERASLYGGSVEAGPRPGGGFRVLARLPLPPAGT